MIRKILSLVVVVICVILGSYTFGKSEENNVRWIYYGTSGYGDNYYDKDSIINVKLNVIKVWDKIKFSQVGKDDTVKKRKDNYFSIGGFEKLDYEIILHELDCVNNTGKMIRFIYYNDEGMVLDSLDDTNPKIEQVIPGSMRELLIREVCKK